VRHGRGVNLLRVSTRVVLAGVGAGLGACASARLLGAARLPRVASRGPLCRHPGGIRNRVISMSAAHAPRGLMSSCHGTVSCPSTVAAYFTMPSPPSAVRCESS
jgi:hypothetical protein